MLLQLKNQRQGKHGNQKVGQRDSKGEQARWEHLKILERVGSIDELIQHITFPIIAPTENVRGVSWTPDYAYYDIENKVYVVEDFKYYGGKKGSGTARDKAFRITVKAFHLVYPWYSVRIYSKARGLEVIFPGERIEDNMARLVLDEKMTVRILENIRDGKPRSMEEIANVLRNRGPLASQSVSSSIRLLIKEGFFVVGSNCWEYRRVNFNDADYIQKNRRTKDTHYCILPCKVKSVLTGRCCMYTREEFHQQSIGELAESDSGGVVVASCRAIQ
jgi:hypothetical protein